MVKSVMTPSYPHMGSTTQGTMRRKAGMLSPPVAPESRVCGFWSPHPRVQILSLQQPWTRSNLLCFIFFIYEAREIILPTSWLS